MQWLEPAACRLLPNIQQPRKVRRRTSMQFLKPAVSMPMWRGSIRHERSARERCWDKDGSKCRGRCGRFLPRRGERSARGSQIARKWEAKALLRVSQPHDSLRSLLINKWGQLEATWAWAQVPSFAWFDTITKGCIYITYVFVRTHNYAILCIYTTTWFHRGPICGSVVSHEFLTRT